MGRSLNVLFKDKTIGIIDRIYKKSGVKDRGDVIRDALALYDKIDKIAKSGKLIIRDYDTKHPDHILTIPRKKK